ncbi:HAD family hydrolase [Falsibacillus pallidus]|uniref:Putative hydrolase of the HAD superfamily n=1 Tax=Falsibacillus pallidus TaxID=493781 RepID=A0A370GPW1_9BACI|nr:HAD family hydrolase [Falsibacillus pallidus]RDI45561.1 putative hydrolase of the HAD superfamily [Falsibacillus pallidus]
MNNKIKTIFFDAGGVLFDTPIKGDERIINLLTERGYHSAKIDLAISKAKHIKPPFITSWYEEEKYYKHFYGIIAEELGEVKLTNELLHFAHYAGHCELFSEVKEVLESLITKYELAVISNAMPSMDWIFDRLGIRKYFKTIILSANVNEEKPSKGIYYTSLNQMEATPEESIFIDDKIENVEGAEIIGMRGIHLDRRRKNLKELLSDERILYDSLMPSQK